MTTAPDTPPSTPAEILATPVQYLRGVGPQRSALFERIGLYTARDVLFYFPRDYQDLTDLNSVDDLEENKLLRLRGTVLDVESRVGRGGRSVVGVLVRCGMLRLRALWFNLPYMRDKFRADQQLVLTGKARYQGGVWQLSHPNVEWIDTEPDEPPASLIPIYSLTEGLRQPVVRRAVHSALDMCAGLLDEVFPDAYRAAHHLLPIGMALPALHFPHDRAALATAQRRFVYQELLILQLALAVRRQRLQVLAEAPALVADARIDARIRRLFPFELTAGQQQAITEVAADLAQPVPMNRLLQGDVGSGKTMVAMYALLLAVAHGQQAALMAPTEILARQHAATLGALLTHSRVRWACLTGSTAARDRQSIVAQLAAGELDVVLGTQAVLQEDVRFARLGLVVIDEQHKFGVRQRAGLKRAGGAPHYLVMTATPIPRSMALTQFGDLEVSTIRDAPPGRQTVHTYLASDGQRAAWWEFVGKKLREGRQAYVIAPLVEVTEAALDEALEDGSPAPVAVDQLYESLVNGPLAEFRVGIVHGRMTPREKEAAMTAFRTGATQVLVATTVVEVGVDVPNATVMTIEGGHCFGLSQLHQLRGRICRGKHPGYCTVFAEVTNDESRARLEAFTRSTDGFELAEIDFQLRGPGDLLGTQQHGLPPLRIADLRRDAAVLQEARDDARQLVADDPGLARPEHAALRKMVLRRYGQVLDLGDAG